jgi:glycosyltransferase involved in cell wall biosynthesis
VRKAHIPRQKKGVQQLRIRKLLKDEEIFLEQEEVSQMAEQQSTLSLCMIARDEEKLLERCISSVRDFADEIIIADTGSKDRTAEIAKKYTDNVYNFEWADDFSAARNFSISKATKDWILVLDADETIAEDDMKKLKELIQESDADAYRLIQRNYSYSTKGNPVPGDYAPASGYRSYFPSVLTRLFRNKGYKFSNKVHELVEDSIKGKIVNSGIAIHHMRDDSKDRDALYIRLCEKQIQDEPESPKPYYELAKIHSSRKEYPKAIELFRKSISLLGNTKGLLIHKLVFLDIGEACFKSGDYRNAVLYLDKAIEHEPGNCGPYFYKALVLHGENNVEEAELMYKKSIELGIKDPIAYGNLGNIELKKGDYRSALSLLSISVELGNPKKEAIEALISKIQERISKAHQ